MVDREHTLARDLDEELRELGTQIEYPVTPDLARQVRRSVEENAGETTGRQSIIWLPALSPKWVTAAAVLLLLLLVPILSSTTRDTLFAVFSAGAGGAGSAGGEGGADVQSGGAASDRAAGGAAQSPGAESSNTTPSSGADVPSSGDIPSSGSGATRSTEENFDRKIIKTAELGIRAKDVRGSAEEAQRIIAQLGGNVLNSQVDRDNGKVLANLTLVVPSGEFDEALDKLRGLGGKITTDAVESEDVTEEFVDLESRERNLLATEKSLLKLYDRLEDVNDTLSIQRELTNVRGEVEHVQGRIQYLEQSSEASRINLLISPVEEAAVPVPVWSPTSTIGQAWNASLGFLQGIATVLLSVAVFSWWLVPMILFGVVWWRAHTRGPDSDTTVSSRPRP